MFQRSASHWAEPGWDRDRPRLLIEDHADSLRIVDFTTFHDAGFEVAFCTGPDHYDPCPLVTQGTCDLAARADVVLFRLGTEDPSDRAVLRAFREQLPDTPVVIQLPGSHVSDDDLAEGCTVLPGTASVEGQIHALRKAAFGVRTR